MTSKLSLMIMEWLCAILVVWIVLFSDWERWEKSVILFFVLSVFLCVLISLVRNRWEQECTEFVSYDNDDS